MTIQVRALDLTKTYADGTKAVDGVSFDVQQGEIFGLLGPNGAGKTTIIQILTGLMPKTAGLVTVAGYDISCDAQAVRRIVGFVPQGSSVDLDYTVREDLLLQGQLYGMSTLKLKQNCNDLLSLFKLEESATRSARLLSGGMRRKVDLALALVHEPLILFLDEPTAGLDLQTRKVLWYHLIALRAAGITVFLTTQYLEEADQLADHLVIINQGRVVVRGTPAQLREGIGTLDQVFLHYTGEAYHD